MGIHTTPGIKRAEPFLAVSLLHSKTGHVVLRGSSFYDRSLDFRVSHYNKDAFTITRSIEHQKKQVLSRRKLIMSRSEKLVSVYNLPPLKSTGQTLSSDKPNVSMNRSEVIPTENFAGKFPKSHLLKDRHKGTNNELSSSHIFENNVVYDSTSNLRTTMSSPAPREHVEDVLDSSSYLRHKESDCFPAILVQKCDDGGNSPRTPRKQNKCISDDMRTLSANNLFVPTPLLFQRREAGKIGSQNENISRSEGSLNIVFDKMSLEKENKLQPFSAPINSDRTRPVMRTSCEIAVEEFRRNREMYSPSTLRRPVRLIALSESSRSHSAIDVNVKPKH